MNPTQKQGLQLLAQANSQQSEILSPEALELLAALHREFNPRRLQLLEERKRRQAAIDQGEMPRFLTETKSIREQSWHVSPVPSDLQNRRVEITGPVDRK